MGLLCPSGQGPMVFMQMSLDFEGAHMRYCRRSLGDPLNVRFEKAPALRDHNKAFIWWSCPRPFIFCP